MMGSPFFWRALLIVLYTSSVATARTSAVQACSPPAQTQVLKASSSDPNVNGKYATISSQSGFQYIKFTTTSSASAANFAITEEGYLQGTYNGNSVFADRGSSSDIRYVSMATQAYIDNPSNSLLQITCSADSGGVLTCFAGSGSNTFSLLQSCTGGSGSSSDKGWLELGNRIGNGPCYADTLTLIDLTPPNTCTSTVPTSTATSTSDTGTIPATTTTSSASCTDTIPPTPTYILKGESADNSIDGNYATVLQDSNAGFFYIFFKTSSNSASSFILNDDTSLQSGNLFAERNFGSQTVDYVGLASAANLHSYTEASCSIDALGYLQCSAQGTIFQACPDDAANNDYAKGYLQIGSELKSGCSTVALKAVNIAADACASTVPPVGTTLVSSGGPTSSIPSTSDTSTSDPGTSITSDPASSTTSTSDTSTSTVPDTTTTPSATIPVVVPTATCTPSTCSDECSGFTTVNLAQSGTENLVCGSTTIVSPLANAICETDQTQNVQPTVQSCATQCLQNCDCKSFALTYGIPAGADTVCTLYTTTGAVDITVDVEPTTSVAPDRRKRQVTGTSVVYDRDCYVPVCPSQSSSSTPPTSTSTSTTSTSPSTTGTCLPLPPIENGGFESGTLAPFYGRGVTVVAGTTDHPCFDGIYCLPIGTTGTVSYTFGTIIGHTYEVALYSRPDDADSQNNQIFLSIDSGVAHADCTSIPYSDQTTFSYQACSVSALDTSATLSFTALVPGLGNSIYIDDVSVVDATPDLPGESCSMPASSTTDTSTVASTTTTDSSTTPTDSTSTSSSGTDTSTVASSTTTDSSTTSTESTSTSSGTDTSTVVSSTTTDSSTTTTDSSITSTDSTSTSSSGTDTNTSAAPTSTTDVSTTSTDSTSTSSSGTDTNTSVAPTSTTDVSTTSTDSTSTSSSGTDTNTSDAPTSTADSSTTSTNPTSTTSPASSQTTTSTGSTSSTGSQSSGTSSSTSAHPGSSSSNSSPHGSSTTNRFPTSLPHHSHSSSHHYASYTTSTIYTTFVYTITACPHSITNCPVGSITTETIAISTTVCPVTPTSTSQHVPTSPYPENTTSTIYSTLVYTVTACPKSITNCPVGSVTTETIAISTTVCPVTSPSPPNSSNESPGATAYSPEVVITSTVSVVPVLTGTEETSPIHSAPGSPAEETPTLTESAELGSSAAVSTVTGGSASASELSPAVPVSSTSEASVSQINTAPGLISTMTSTPPIASTTSAPSATATFATVVGNSGAEVRVGKGLIWSATLAVGLLMGLL